MTDHSDLIERITGYLATGGLFNPELANHDAVRALLIESRDALSSQSLSLSEAREEIERVTRQRDEAVEAGRVDLMQHIRMLEAVTREQATEIERLVRINAEICRGSNILNQDGARLTDALRAVEAERDALRWDLDVETQANHPLRVKLETERDAALEALRGCDEALRRSSAMRHRTCGEHSISVFFHDLERAEQFQAFIRERCAAIRAGATPDGNTMETSHEA